MQLDEALRKIIICRMSTVDDIDLGVSCLSFGYGPDGSVITIDYKEAYLMDDIVFAYFPAGKKLVKFRFREYSVLTEYERRPEFLTLVYLLLL